MVGSNKIRKGFGGEIGIPATAPTDKRHGMLAAGRAQNFCDKGANRTLKQYQSSQHHWRAVSSEGPWQEFRYHPKENVLSCLSSDHYGDEVECPR